MRVLILSCDPKSIKDLLLLAERLREKKHFVYIVAARRTGTIWREHGFVPDIPGHGWLPYEVNDMDTWSYLKKRNVHAMVLNRYAHALEQRFAKTTYNRPALVLANPSPATLRDLPKHELHLTWARPPRTQTLTNAVRSIVALVATRP